MPILTDPGAEAFAHVRARGAHLEDAYEPIGFGGEQDHADWFDERPELAARFNPQDLDRAVQRQSVSGATARDGTRGVAANQPADRLNKPETARFRPHYAAPALRPSERIGASTKRGRQPS